VPTLSLLAEHHACELTEEEQGCVGGGSDLLGVGWTNKGPIKGCPKSSYVAKLILLGYAVEAWRYNIA
jgi:hypothetical protein